MSRSFQLENEDSIPGSKTHNEEDYKIHGMFGNGRKYSGAQSKVDNKHFLALTKEVTVLAGRLFFFLFWPIQCFKNILN